MRRRRCETKAASASRPAVPGERSKRVAGGQGVPKISQPIAALQPHGNVGACWFSLVVAWKQERVADGRFGGNMGH
jgi:hypothetical protein